MFAICAAGGTKEKIYKNITMHNWVVDSCKLDKKIEHIHMWHNLIEIDVKVHKSPEPTI